MDTKNKIFTVIGTIALVAATTVGGYALYATGDATSQKSVASTSQTVSSQPSATTSTVASTQSPTSSVQNTTSPTTTNSYKDGTYTVSTSYFVPHGNQNSISATVSISGGKITAVTTKDSYSDHESAMYVGSFEGSVSSDASGQSIASYSPSRIGGASLTTAAFSDVLDQVRSQAATS